MDIAVNPTVGKYTWKSWFSWKWQQVRSFLRTSWKYLLAVTLGVVVVGAAVTTIVSRHLATPAKVCECPLAKKGEKQGKKQTEVKKTEKK